MIDDTKCYAAWRRREAYMIPMTKEGMKAAEGRYHEFKKGYIAGVNAAAFEMEKQHRANKHIHKFYLFAHDFIRSLVK